MKSKIKFNFRKKIWRLKEEFKTSNRRNDTNQVVTIEAIIKKNNIDLQIANDNSPIQVVISGKIDLIENYRNL